jgi:hypothetical protein
MHCQLLKMIHWSINKMLDEHQKLMYYLISCASSCQLISVSCYYDYIQPLVVVEQLPIDICTSGWLISKIFYRLGVFWSYINWFHLYIVEFRRKKKLMNIIYLIMKCESIFCSYKYHLVINILMLLLATVSITIQYIQKPIFFFAIKMTEYELRSTMMLSKCLEIFSV